ncbi:hypothetical protein [Streptomyces sp. PH10-H1]|uniref:hypothetical protein n=1 Tax=Streptomyces sp. PH10-H1 TaxID=3046212 RepID=UPI0024B8CC82|nr:hypothetical protein [Streptomyces sp. PH10-H1]MDJ0346753.1 hypothetical protein [Streptomyces sp. PH10-H1]
MLNLLMRNRVERQTPAPRRFLSAVADAVRSVVSPASLMVEAQEITAPDPAGLYAPEEIPAVETIEAAAAELDRAAEQARRADRGKRAARKVLDRLPAGRYGAWTVSRTPSARHTVDLVEVARIFKANGLGQVPMKRSAPSLKVERTAVLEPSLYEVARIDREHFTAA